MALVAVTVVPARVTLGLEINSVEVKERVMLSPDFARFVALFVDEIVTLLRVGLVVSKVTEVWSSVVVFGEPRLPAWSSTSILKEAWTFYPS